MASVTRFSPFRSSFNDLAVLQNRLNSIFSDFGRPESEGDQLAAGNFVPAVDVYEDEHKLVLKFEVPGIKPDDLIYALRGVC
jgi:HSP20 family protein